jgi:hypothetical protein
MAFAWLVVWGTFLVYLMTVRRFFFAGDFDGQPPISY